MGKHEELAGFILNYCSTEPAVVPDEHLQTGANQMEEIICETHGKPGLPIVTESVGISFHTQKTGLFFNRVRVPTAFMSGPV